MICAKWLAVVIAASAIAGCDRSSDPGVFFPTWDTSHGVPGALLEDATLVREDGCLFARPAPGVRGLLLVWPDGFRFESEEGGRVVDAAGDVVATVGGRLRLGGGIPSTSHAEELIGEPIPEACRRPGDETVWLVGEVL